MECEICALMIITPKRVHCASCARSMMYLARLEAARILLEKESLGRQIQSLTSVDPTEPKAGITSKKSRLWVTESQRAKRDEVMENTKYKSEAIRNLQGNLEKLKEDRKMLYDNITSKRDNLKAIKLRVPENRQVLLDRVSEVQNKGEVSFKSLHEKTMDTKVFLCQEAAALLRLKQKRRLRAGIQREQYSIAGLMLPDLRDINGIRCTDMTAVLASTAHLLALIAFYLGVRLPAEITLPHRDYPLTTINTPSTSYISKKTQFPGTGSHMSLPSSPTASRHDGKPVARPRPLFIGSDDREEKVAQIAKKDSGAFNFFLEGISLLIWDVSWLCHIQGFQMGTESWEDACNVGRNLWNLIHAAELSSPDSKNASSRDPRHRPKKNKIEPSKIPNHTVNGKLGNRSHASAYGFLGSATEDSHRSWKLNKYTMIFDPLKKTLLTEMNNAEWELLEEQEWDDGGEQFDEAVFIKTRAMDGQGYDDARSIMTTKTQISEAPDDNASDGARIRGRSGWTKIKNRDKT